LHRIYEQANYTNSKKWNKASSTEDHRITEKEAHLLAKKHHLEILHSMWAYKIKSDKKGFIKEFRCRITQCGNGDVTMTSRDDGFSPVIRQMTTRALISETQATHNLECFDAPLAYLNGMARRLIIMHAPPGHAKFDTEGRPMKVILRRNLYGGVDSGKIWGEMLDEELHGCGLIKSVNDPCLYFNDDRSVILTTYVDDILMAWNDITKKDRVVRILEGKFAIKHEGPLATTSAANTTSRLKAQPSTIPNSSEHSDMTTLAKTNRCYPRTHPSTRRRTPHQRRNG